MMSRTLNREVRSLDVCLTRRWRLVQLTCPLFACVLLAWVGDRYTPASFAQQIGIQTPAVGVSSSYFERAGVNFGFQLGIPQGGSGSRVVGYGPGGINPHAITFSQGGFRSAIPIFGGYDPNSGGRFGFSSLHNGSGFSLGIEMSKGSTRMLNASSPMIVVPNGVMGSFASGGTRPFVVGTVPVVGDAGYSIRQPGTSVASRVASDPSMVEQLRASMAARRGVGASTPARPASSSGARPAPPSTAQRGELSVAEIRAQRELQRQQQQAEAESLLERALEHLDADEVARARTLLQRAWHLADEPQRELIAEVLRELP